MLADRVRMGSGNNEVSVNIQVKDSSDYVSSSDKLYIIPIIKGFELDPSKFDTKGRVDWRYIQDEIIPLYCGDAIEAPRHSTINVTTLKSKYFIIDWNGFIISCQVNLTNRYATVKNLNYLSVGPVIWELSEDLEDGDIVEVKAWFD